MSAGSIRPPRTADGPLTRAGAPINRRLPINNHTHSPPDRFNAAHRSRRAERDRSGAQSERQEAGDPGAFRARREAHRAERAADLRDADAAREARAAPASATASRSRTASCRSSKSWSACSRGSSVAIDFESLDGQPVDLIFLLLAPEGAGADHLKALARVARLLREPEMVARLRESRDADALYAVLAHAALGSRLTIGHRGRALSARPGNRSSFTNLRGHGSGRARRRPRSAGGLRCFVPCKC